MGYVGHGFRSDSSVIGNFSFTFYHPGVYHYIAENYAHIGVFVCVYLCMCVCVSRCMEVGGLYSFEEKMNYY